MRGVGGLYPPHVLFAADRGGFDESRFWFEDAVGYSEPDYRSTSCFSLIVAGLSQASARLFAVPTSLGLQVRILGGYVFITPNSITDEARSAAGRTVRSARGLLLRALGRARSALARESTGGDPRARGARGPEPARRRRRRPCDRGPRRWLGPRPLTSLRPPPRELRPHGPLSLRAPQPDVMGRTRSLRSLSPRVPGHLRSDGCEDGDG